MFPRLLAFWKEHMYTDIDLWIVLFVIGWTVVSVEWYEYFFTRLYSSVLRSLILSTVFCRRVSLSVLSLSHRFDCRTHHLDSWEALLPLYTFFFPKKQSPLTSVSLSKSYTYGLLYLKVWYCYKLIHSNEFPRYSCLYQTLYTYNYIRERKKTARPTIIFKMEGNVAIIIQLGFKKLSCNKYFFWSSDHSL